MCIKSAWHIIENQSTPVDIIVLSTPSLSSSFSYTLILFTYDVWCHVLEDYRVRLENNF